jgi:hypothetical protein
MTDPLRNVGEEHLARNQAVFRDIDEQIRNRIRSCDRALNLLAGRATPDVLAAIATVRTEAVNRFYKLTNELETDFDGLRGRREASDPEGPSRRAGARLPPEMARALTQRR